MYLAVVHGCRLSPRIRGVRRWPSDASSLVSCCLFHHPINCLIEEQYQNTAALSHAGHHIEAGFAASNPACEGVVKVLDDEDNFVAFHMP